MPISDEALQSEKNRFVAVTADATVGQAIAAWQDLGGQPWWHLAVRMEDGSWRIARFSALYDSLGPAATASEIRLSGLKELTSVPSVERDSLDTSDAQALARKGPTRVLVVTADGLPVGILVEGVRRGAGLMVSSASIEELGGKYVKLKDYGSILLGPKKK